eukprot:TRINITY_DN1821_c0_g1_i2.p2 TRINITY_DN1821_c0_g1~~TRINITY_DN1821_c0_g1_i2.p2  ORF type:complete len:202 (+),score=22.31 TRINITY_DN1821_c0_g1_i2:130-735(+)
MLMFVAVLALQHVVNVQSQSSIEESLSRLESISQSMDQSCIDEMESTIDEVLNALVDSLDYLAQQSACVALGASGVTPDEESKSLLQNILASSSRDCSVLIFQNQATMKEFFVVGDKFEKTVSGLEALQEAQSACDDGMDTTGGRKLLFHLSLQRIICILTCLLELLKVYWDIVSDGVITFFEYVRWLRALWRFTQCVRGC